MSGKAFDVTVDKLNPAAAGYIEDYFTNTLNRIGIGKHQPIPVGSLNKDSWPIGDLDLLIKSDISLEHIAKSMVASSPGIIDFKIVKGFKMISFLLKMKDKPSGKDKHFQVDLFVMPLSCSDDTIRLFFLHEDEEKYTHKHRFFLLLSILDTKGYSPETRVLSKTRTKYTLRPDGIYKLKKELQKTAYKTVEREFVTDDLLEISKILFGFEMEYKDWNTFKKIWEIVVDYLPYPYIVAKEYIETLRKFNVEVPSEVRIE